MASGLPTVARVWQSDFWESRNLVRDGRMAQAHLRSSSFEEVAAQPEQHYWRLNLK